MEISSRKIAKAPCLPEQLIFEEMLPRLPVKSLLKFRCVSKEWCSVIGSKRFIKAHFSSNNCFFIDYVEGKFKQCSLASMFVDKEVLAHPISPFADLGIDYERDNVSLVGSCNGLVCILTQNEKFILWNPTTKKFKNLPEFNNRRSRGFIENGMSRGFIENGMSRGFIIKYGFGFDELNDDYKVFVTRCGFGENGNNFIGKVYSLRSNSWKDIEETEPVSPFGHMKGKGIYVSGKLHWYSREGDIVSLDLNRHVFGVVELPSYTSGVFRSVGAVGGCLSAYFRHPNKDLDVWLMKEYGVKESWDKVATVPHYNVPDYCELLTFVAPNGEILLVYDSTIVVYNPNSGVIRHPQVIGFDDWFATIKCMGIYIESLASVES